MGASPFFLFFLFFAASVSEVGERLRLEFGVVRKMQILLLAQDGQAVRELRAGSLEANEVPLPLPDAMCVFLFDKRSMAPGGVPPMLALNRFHAGPLLGDSVRESLRNMVGVFELQRAQVDALLTQHASQIQACRVAVSLLEQKAAIFRPLHDEFVRKWKVIAQQHPMLIASANECVERLKETKIHPQLGWELGRTLWDLYRDRSEADIIMFARKSQNKHANLASKLKVHLESCQRTLSDVDELLNRPYETLETLEQTARGLTHLSQVRLPFLERRLVQAGDGPPSAEFTSDVAEMASEYERLLKEAETFVNNHTLLLQLRLQKVTSLSQLVWQLQEQIKGVLGMAVEELLGDFHRLLIMNDLPMMQDVLVEEALCRAQFRQRVSASMRLLETTLEPALVDETNRRANFLADRHPFVRKFLAERFPWVKDEPLSLNIPLVPAFDRHLPSATLAVYADTDAPLVECRLVAEPGATSAHLSGSMTGGEKPPATLPESPSPALAPALDSLPPKDKEEVQPSPDGAQDEQKAQADADADADSQLIEEYRARIQYLERQLARRVERSASQMEVLKGEHEALKEENKMLQSERSIMEQTLSMHVMRESEEQRQQQEEEKGGPVNANERPVAILSDFGPGDRVVFFKNPDSGFYEAVQGQFGAGIPKVFLSRTSCDAFSSIQLGPVFVATIIEDVEHVVAGKGGYFKLPEGTLYTELTVALD